MYKLGTFVGTLTHNENLNLFISWFLWAWLDCMGLPYTCSHALNSQWLSEHPLHAWRKASMAWCELTKSVLLNMPNVNCLPQWPWSQDIGKLLTPPGTGPGYLSSTSHLLRNHMANPSLHWRYFFFFLLVCLGCPPNFILQIRNLIEAALLP